MKRKNHAGTMSRFESTAYRTCAIRDRHPGLSCRKLVASLRRLSEIQALSGGSLEPGVVEPYPTEQLSLESPEGGYTHIRLV